MEKTKKSIFSKIFVCLSLCLVLLGALAPCFSMTRNEPLKADSYEDGSVKFVGSEVWFPYDYYYFRVGSNNLVSLQYSYDYSSLNGSYVVDSNGDFIDVFASPWLSTNIRISFSVDSDNQLYLDYPIPSYAATDGSGGQYFLSSDMILTYGSRILISDIKNKVTYYTVFSQAGFALKSYCRCDDLFDYTNVYHVDIYSSTDYSGKYVYIDYRDKNNYSLRIAFYIADDFEYPFRTYYFEAGLNLTDNQYYDQGFNAGYSDGYNKGNTDGNKQGYDTGYKAGNTIGFENGYNKGLNDSNQYSFVNLIGATIDAPMQYFKSLFNFELLGVNLSGFLMGLFTLCIIITIVKLCLGR